MPGDRFCLLCLAQALEQPHAASVRVEGIDVIDDDELITMLVQFDIHAERGGVAFDPAGLPIQYRPHQAALGQTAGANKDEQVEMPTGEGSQVFLQPLVSCQMQDLVGLFPTAFPLYWHGVSPVTLSG